jgi:hypothetical protein
MVYQRIFDKNQVNILEKEITNLLSIGVIKQVAFDEHQYISPIFTLPKKGKNEYRMILNLKELNEYIEPHHFQMETFESALKLIKPFRYVASIDLRHAYYSINMAVISIPVCLMVLQVYQAYLLNL